MKKLIIVLSLIGLWACLSAFAWNLSSLKLSELNLPNEALNSHVRALSESGIEIYHYNDHYVLAKVTPELSSSAWSAISEPLAGERLYLLSKIKASAPAEIQQTARILADLGNELLIASDHDIVTLRTSLKGSFTLLESQAIRFPAASPKFEAVRDTRTEIQQLISQVSADSVMAFIQGMQNLQTRYALADNRLDVANWIKGQFQRFGISNATLQSFQWNGLTQYNVLATIEGSLYPDEYIVVGGHHDSITYTTPLVLAPGADDNASGSVAAIEMARVLMLNNYHPKCSIRFVTFAAEEFGLWGSKHNSNTSAAAGDDIRLMINHDMISNNNPGNSYIALMPYDGALEQTQHAAAITEQYTDLSVVYGYMNSSSSDSHSYWVNGYPVIYYFETDFSPYYHSDQDITANIDPVYAAEVIRGSMAVAISFADMPAAPRNPMVRDTGDGTSLFVSWDEIVDPQLDHFRVYYSPDSWQSEQYIDVTGFSCTLTNLTTGTPYQLGLCSVDLSGNESYKVYSFGTPQLVPLCPEGFGDHPGLHSVQLSWLPNQEIDLAGYQIYRSQDPAQLGTLITPQAVTGINFTDFEVQGNIDVYYFYRIAALDLDGNQSEKSEPLMTRPVTLDNGVLIVDESLDYSGSNPFQPTDEMVDDFFSGIMDNFEIQQLDLINLGTLPRLADIGIYSSILWHGMDNSDLTIPYAIRAQLARYLELGGNIFFTGYQPTLAFGMNDGYPATFDADSYLSEVLGIASAQYNIQSRFKFALPLLDSFPALQVDSLKTSSALHGHIIRVETIGAAAAAMPIYAYGSDYEDSSVQGQFNGETVAVLNEYDEGRIFTLSFPLYHMEESSSRSLVNHVFRYYFTESSPTEDLVTPVLPLSIRSYPNPFQSVSNLELRGLDPKQPMKLEIYNLKGQKIRTLHHAEAKSSLSWDAKDEAGRDVANGIYFVKLSQQGRSITKKMTRITR